MKKSYLSSAGSAWARVALVGAAIGGLSALGAGCARDGEAPEVEAVGAASQAVGVCAPSLDPAKSLTVTNPAVLARFPLQAVLGQILATANVVGPSPLELYRRWWDTQNTTTGGFFNDALAIHCDSQLNSLGQPSINGFPIQCPRLEGALGNPANPLTDPFIDGTPTTQPNFMKPVAIVNRFDLAPTDGSHCGEYRIVYAKKSGETNNLNRVTVIFEGVLPNPNPSCGLLACRPVADFWANLSNETDFEVIADQLEDFYFNGLPGFTPVVDANHYGMGALGGGYGATSKGQVRTNMFISPGVSQPWQLREFQLERVCSSNPKDTSAEELTAESVASVEPPPAEEALIDDGAIIKPPVTGACMLRFKPVTVKNNPFFRMFNSASTDARTADFRTDFADNQVEPLTNNNIDFIGMATPDTFNAGESNALAAGGQPVHDYRTELTGNTTFITSINARLTALGRTDLISNQLFMAQRANTQQCAGCHDVSNNDPLGGAAGPTWPPSLGFVHIDEFSNLSNAVKFVFLPRRKAVLADFLDQTCGEICDDCGGVVIKSKVAPGSQNGQVKTLGGAVSH